MEDDIVPGDEASFAELLGAYEEECDALRNPNAPLPKGRKGKVVWCEEFALPENRMVFERWARAMLRAQHHGETERCKARIAAIRVLNPTLEEARKKRKQAERELQAHEDFAKLKEVQSEIKGTEHALGKIQENMERIKKAGKKLDKLKGAQVKEAEFKERMTALKSEEKTLCGGILGELQANVESATIDYENLKEEMGIKALEERKAELNALVSKKRTKAGDSWNMQTAVALGKLVQRFGVECGAVANVREGSEVVVLSEQSFNMRDGELDVLICEPEEEEDPGGCVTLHVLAICEAKANIEDVGSGWEKQQERVAWLCGDRERYDPKDWKCKLYSTGHFETVGFVEVHKPKKYVLERRGKGASKKGKHPLAACRYRLTPHSFRDFKWDEEANMYLQGVFISTTSNVRPVGITKDKEGEIATLLENVGLWLALGMDLENVLEKEDPRDPSVVDVVVKQGQLKKEEWIEKFQRDVGRVMRSPPKQKRGGPPKKMYSSTVAIMRALKSVHGEGHVLLGVREKS